jgi:putative ABC transport system ATP-binding protein
MHRSSTACSRRSWRAGDGNAPALAEAIDSAAGGATKSMTVAATAATTVYRTGNGAEAVALDHATLIVGADEIVGGEDITHYRERELTEFRQTMIGFVFQAVDLNAQENLLVVDEIGRRTGAAARSRAAQLLEDLGLSEQRRTCRPSPAAGSRQRVAIGRALMNEPKLVLLNEPTSALDSTTDRQVMELIRSEMNRAAQPPAIVVTHDERITEFCDHKRAHLRRHSRRWPSSLRSSPAGATVPRCTSTSHHHRSHATTS